MRQESFNFGIVKGITNTAFMPAIQREMTWYVKLMFLLFTSKSAQTKSNEVVEISFRPILKTIVPYACESTDKGVSSRGSRVKTKFYGSIIDSGSERVLINIYNLTIILNPVLFKSHSNVSVVYVVNFLSHVIFCFSFVFGYGTTVDV